MTLVAKVGSGSVSFITSQQKSTLLGSGGNGGGEDSNDSVIASTARSYMLFLTVCLLPQRGHFRLFQS